jgi:hypothetical protein
MEFSPNFSYILYSATAEDEVYHKDQIYKFNMNHSLM